VAMLGTGSLRGQSRLRGSGGLKSARKLTARVATRGAAARADACQRVGDPDWW
jgi:hypothetical protein